MAKKYRRTLLNEYETLCGLSPVPEGENFRSEIGNFVVAFIKDNGKAPSNKEIIEKCVPYDAFDILDNLHDFYTAIQKHGFPAHAEYIANAEKTGWWG